MNDYKISDWQLDKLHDSILNAYKRVCGLSDTISSKEFFDSIDTNRLDGCAMSLVQSLNIIEAVRNTRPFEQEPINVPTVWLDSEVGETKKCTTSSTLSWVD